ncbi:MAG: translation initiation factor IF-2 [Bacteroidales bacterium]|nr:translation initiation factor IF-2 [Bacteroidales bacterium]
MPEEKIKLPRLGKAATEFNISRETLIAFLKKKNFEIEDNINAKLSAEMYAELLKEFAGEKMVKAEADKIDIGTYSAISKQEPKTKAQGDKQEDDLATKTPGGRESSKKEPSQPEPDNLGKNNETETSAPKPAPEKEPEQPKPEPVTEPVEETPQPEKAKPEHIETHVEPLVGLTIIDKIDPETLNPKKKGHKGSSKKQEAEKEEAPVEKVEEVPDKEPVEEVKEEPVTPAEPEEPARPENFIETRVEKIQGPKIMGKIELPVEKPKESSKKDKHVTQEDKKKKKRKRILKQNNGNLKQIPAKEEKKSKPEPEKVEISPEDIQRRIKETKMRIDNTGAKNKAAKRRKEKRQLIHERIEEQELQEIANQNTLKVTEFLTANELATLMNKDVTEIISTCMSIGLFVSINQRLDAETISLLAEEFGFKVEFIGADAEDDNNQEVDREEDLQPRHPIITVMGHVDHGKTSLLDYIRKTNVIAGEAGGITQHIGAYEVSLSDGRKITFLDTPGHEAFTAMRARGAKITDLCIIVVAADDAVMPQTIEAINHAQAAGVPMVFAITKIDKPNADPERIRTELANMNILVEDWGGNYQCQEIDAKHGTNVKELLEKVLLEAELLDLKANPNRPGLGAVIESSLDKGRGYVAKVLVQNGTLRIGDPVLAGSCFGKVKAMFNERNQAVKSAGPATPVLMLGLNGAPQAGDSFKVCESEQEARNTATKRARLAREMGLRTQKHITLDEIGRRIAIGDFKELNIIVKGDVDGSVEALSGELLKLSTEQVQLNVIHKSVGAVTETDVMLATASNALIVAFQVRPTAGARKMAEAEQIDIRTYSIIYTAINEIKDAIAGMHSPEIREKVIANLEIKEVFHISKVGNIAGCMVLDGKLQRSSKIRLIRDGIVIYTGKLGSLRRFKDDVKEVVSGQDCGLNIDGCNDLKVGDIIEGFEEYEVAFNANK